MTRLLIIGPRMHPRRMRRRKRRNRRRKQQPRRNRQNLSMRSPQRKMAIQIMSP
jgi:hypothetical protein